MPWNVKVCPNQRQVKGCVVLPRAACRHIIPMCEESATTPAVLYAALPRLPLAFLRLVLLEAQSCSGGVAFTILFLHSNISTEAVPLLGNQLANLISSLDFVTLIQTKISRNGYKLKVNYNIYICVCV